MIGEGKAAAVREYLAAVGADPANTWGYGDHASDLPLLEAVAHPVVVGDDPSLRAYVDREGWERVTDASAPLPDARRLRA
jgi:phosphoserine phosphatase